MKTITIDGIEYQLTPIATEAPKPVQWEPERLDKNQRYWFIDNGGDLYGIGEDLLTMDAKRASFGNYFHTKQEADGAAKQVRQLLRLRAYVREFAPDYKSNWDNLNQLKWFVIFDEEHQKWSYNCSQYLHTPTIVYMPECVAKELVKKLNNGEVVL